MDQLTIESHDRAPHGAASVAALAREGRLLMLSAPLRDLIERRWRRRALGCALVFHRDGYSLEHHFEGPWRQACKAAGAPGRLFHDLRWSVGGDHDVSLLVS